MSVPSPALSFVIPLYNSADTIADVVREIEGLEIEGGHEIILVNDGSRDRTSEVVRELLADTKIPLTVVEHARNFGEHNAVLTGWRHARGLHVVNLDDDGQNPPSEAVRLWKKARAENLDVVYGKYRTKEHAMWRNAGSWLTNRLTDCALDKPRGLYLSSFRCVSGFIARQVSGYGGPFPYIDGLVLQATQRIGTVEVEHRPRAAGTSGYTFRKLFRLWLSTWVNFSVMPLRVAALCGLLFACAGFAGFAAVLYLWATDQGPAFGWGSLMATILLAAGIQLILLGVIGEYLGRMFVAINQRPQAVVREIVSNRT